MWLARLGAELVGWLVILAFLVSTSVNWYGLIQMLKDCGVWCS